MIAHVTINTKDLEGSIGFYQKYIGLEIVEDLRTYGMPIVFMASDGKDETKLELIQSDRPFQGSGICIGFQVADFDERLRFFRKEGLEVSDFVTPNPNIRFFFVTDPNGLKVQMITA